jgi:Zn-dependent protease
VFQSPELLVAAVIVVALMLLVAFPVHEFAHALAAYRLGDGTAKLFGRLTVNPLVHFDRIGGLILAVSVLGSAAAGSLFGFGWAKPTPVNPSNLQGGRYGEAIVALAGPLSNLVLAAAGALPLRYLIATPELAGQLGILVQILVIFVYLNLILMIFNLLPIPPLDGSRVLFSVLDARTVWRIKPILEQYGLLIIILLFFFPPGASIGAQIIFPVIDAIFSILVGT